MSIVKRRNCIPNGSIIRNGFGEFNYCDSYETVINVQNRSIDQILSDLFDLSSLPWIVLLKRIRDSLVQPFGLQIDEGILTNKTSSYNPGSKVFLFAFTVLKRTVNEIVMGKNDKHLNYRLSLFLAQNDSKVYVTTIIKFHNLGGRSYFGLIRPFHQLIVYSLVKKNLSLTI